MSEERNTTIAAAITGMFRPGSYHGAWSWQDETLDLFSGERAAATIALLRTIAEDGEIREAVVLGHDGRVWDGHHRIIIGGMLGMRIPYVVVEAP
jgi:hypothetical protein